MSEQRKLPAVQFYTGDWLKDPALRACSAVARGVWMDMLCLMHESPERGHLMHANGKPVTAHQLTRMAGCTPDEVDAALEELDDCGVFSRTEEGVIYCRRMVRDERKRRLCSEAGKRGGNPTLKGRSKGDTKGEAKGDGNGDAKRNRTPSSSPSPSSSTAPSHDDGDSSKLIPEIDKAGCSKGRLQPDAKLAAGAGWTPDTFARLVRDREAEKLGYGYIRQHDIENAKLAHAYASGTEPRPKPRNDGPPPSAAYQRQPTEEERRIQRRRLKGIEKRKQKERQEKATANGAAVEATS